MATLPSDAEPLSVEGFFCSTSDSTSMGISFSLYVPNSWGHQQEYVCDVLYPQRAWTYNADDYRHKVQLRILSQTVLGTHGKAIAEVLRLAIDFAEVLDESVADKIAAIQERAAREERERAERMRQREEERARFVEQRRKEREAYEAERVKIYELVRWQAGERFRLRRKGYKATVFGVVDDVTERHMYTTSEKGVKMRIEIGSIELFEIKYDDSKRYTTIYKREETADVTS